MPIFLIGYRGTGKTTVARLLAERLGWPWLDADIELERRAGRTIATIFADQGEPAFRRWETDVLGDFVELNKYVLALGGGVVLTERNRELLHGRGPVVWLTADPETIHARIDADALTAQRRPNLTTGGLAEIRTLLAAREPFYRACAALTVDTEGLSPPAVVEQIMARWPSISGRSAAP